MLKSMLIIIACLAAILLAATQHFSHKIRINAGNIHSQPIGFNNQSTGIVVATGGAGRIRGGLQLMQDGHGARMLISGVGAGVRMVDINRLIAAGGAFDQTRLDQTLACCVDLGYRAVNTKGNAAEALRWVEIHQFNHIIVVTSDVHLPRAMVEFNHYFTNIPLTPHAVPTPWLYLNEDGASGWWHSGRRIIIIGVEMVKYYARKTPVIRSI